LVSFENVVLKVMEDCFESDGAGEEEEHAAANPVINTSVSFNVNFNNTFSATSVWKNSMFETRFH
jgi:hypothetical protein